MKTYFVYGKSKEMKRFSPIDLRNGKFVVNLIYASMLPENEIERCIKSLKEQNPDMEFEKRKAGDYVQYSG